MGVLGFGVWGGYSTTLRLKHRRPSLAADVIGRVQGLDLGFRGLKPVKAPRLGLHVRPGHAGELRGPGPHIVESLDWVDYRIGFGG